MNNKPIDDADAVLVNAVIGISFMHTDTNTLNTPYKEGKTYTYSSGLIINVKSTDNSGLQIYFASAFRYISTRVLSSDIIYPWYDIPIDYAPSQIYAPGINMQRHRYSTNIDDYKAIGSVYLHVLMEFTNLPEEYNNGSGVLEITGSNDGNIIRVIQRLTLYVDGTLRIWTRLHGPSGWGSWYKYFEQ